MSGTIIGKLATRAARAYIAGPQLDDAFSICETLARSGFRSTIGYWNGNEPRTQVAGQYLLALANDFLPRVDSFLSIKAPALGYDPGILAQVMRAALRCGTLVHFDSLGPETADPTLQAIEYLVPTQGKIGLTLPGRWRRSLSDIELAVRLGLHVRVVKGQWADNPGTDCDPADGFFAVVDRLAGRRAVHVRVATHDPQLARRSLSRLLDAGTDCELELLWGLPWSAPVRVARELRVPVRFYVPYGYAWLPYALSQVMRRPRILYWFVRDMLLFTQRTPEPLNLHHLPRKVRVRLGGI